MASIEQRLARLESQRSRTEVVEPDLAAEERQYGKPLWSMGPKGQRAYGQFQGGLYWLTILEANGDHAISYVSAFDPGKAAQS